MAGSIVKIVAGVWLLLGTRGRQARTEA